ncbi:MAG: glutathione synthase [Chromatiales bacterium]|jgi:glutathione synthase
MKITLGIVMDPIEHIKIAKDSSFAMLLEAQARGWTIWYMQQYDLFLDQQKVQAQARRIKLFDDKECWFEIIDEQRIDLADLNVVLMRKDPPFDMRYIYTTYLLELSGSLIVNDTRALRDANEKLSTAWFPQCCTPTLVASEAQHFRDFLQQHGDIIIKPLGGMGGKSIFRVRRQDPNTNVIIETLTQDGAEFVMAQKFIPEISQGDKRILLIDGEPVPYALARIPLAGENRGNLAAGGSGVGVELNERDHWICEQIAPTLRERGILFAGIDVIGDYLTEINITSPTCIRELDRIYDINISARLLDRIEEKLAV